MGEQQQAPVSCPPPFPPDVAFSAGWAIRHRSLAGLALALEMLLLLTQVEARIEARPLSRRPL
jgi:hypothetical protein